MFVPQTIEETVQLPVEQGASAQQVLERVHVALQLVDAARAFPRVGRHLQLGHLARRGLGRRQRALAAKREQDLFALQRPRVFALPGGDDGVLGARDDGARGCGCVF